MFCWFADMAKDMAIIFVDIITMILVRVSIPEHSVVIVVAEAAPPVELYF